MHPYIADWAPSPFDRRADRHPEARTAGVFGLGGGATVSNHAGRLEDAR